MFGINNLSSLRAVTQQYVEAVGDIVAPVLEEDNHGDEAIEFSKGEFGGENLQNGDTLVGGKGVEDEDGYNPIMDTRVNTTESVPEGESKVVAERGEEGDAEGLRRLELQNQFLVEKVEDMRVRAEEMEVRVKRGESLFEQCNTLEQSLISLQEVKKTLGIELEESRMREEGEREGRRRAEEECRGFREEIERLERELKGAKEECKRLEVIVVGTNTKTPMKQQTSTPTPTGEPSTPLDSSIPPPSPLPSVPYSSASSVASSVKSTEEESLEILNNLLKKENEELSERVEKLEGEIKTKGGGGGGGGG